MTIRHIVNGGKAPATVPGNPLGLNYTDLIALETRLVANLKTVHDRGDTFSLNWPAGHTRLALRSAHDFDQLRKGEGLPTMPPKGYADALVEILVAAARRGGVQVWFGTDGLDELWPWPLGRFVNAGIEIVFDHSAAKEFGHPAVRTIDDVARKTKTYVEGPWKPGPEHEWQRRYDAVADSVRTLQNWQSSGGKIPADRTLVVINGVDGVLEPERAALVPSIVLAGNGVGP